MLIRAAWDGARVTLKPAGFLGGVLFDLYRKAASPAVYAPTLKCQVATIDQYLEAEEGLEHAGFMVNRSPALQEALDALEEERADEARELDARLDAIDADLKARGLGLFPYQRDGARFLASRQNALLADDMGCLAGDTVVDVAGEQTTIAALYASGQEKFTMLSLEREEHERGRGQTFMPNLGLRVVHQGVREVVRVTSDRGHIIVATPDHLFATARGWKRADALLGELVLVAPEYACTNPPIVARVLSVEPAGQTETFDVMMQAPYHNFIASGYVVHNCGKTVQILAALPRGARVLVVCPAVVRSVWLAEVKKFRPDFRVRTVQGREHAGTIVPEEGEIVAVSYDLLPESPVDLTGCILVADEAHALKGPKALRTKRFRRLAERASRVWLATATPIANRLEECWHLLSAGRLHLEAFRSWENFLRLCGAKKGRFGLIWPAADKVSPEVREHLDTVMLRRTKLEVLPQLPEKRVRIIEVDLTETLSRACDEMLEELEDMGEALLDSDLEDALPFERLAELRKKLAVAKYPAVEDLVQEYEAQEEPVVVFSAHRFAIDKLGAREGWRVVTGDESDEDRADAVAKFQAGELRGIALTIKAGGVGLTLTRGAHALFLDASYVPAENAQAEDRILRLGQTRGVLITRFVAKHPIDARVEQILRHKTDVIDVVLNRKKKGKKP